MSRYALDNAAEQAETRFTALATSYDTGTHAALTRTGIGPGWRCLEVGGGSGTIGAWLADRVGPDGDVLVTDIEPHRCDALPDRPNVRLLRHDIVTDPLPAGRFDLVHARLVLLHLPERRDVLARLVRGLRVGGWLVIEDFDCEWTPVLAAPAGGAALFSTVHLAFLDLLRDAGADPGWGRRLHSALTASDIQVIDTTTFATSWPGGGSGVELHRANTEQLAGQLRAAGITDNQLTDFWALLRNPAFVVNSYPMITAIGRRIR